MSQSLKPMLKSPTVTGVVVWFVGLGTFLSCAMFMLGFTGCRSFQTPRCKMSSSALQNPKCYPIKSYEGWNKCVSVCSNQPQPKTKPYDPDDNVWIRPAPYAYP